MNAEQVRRLEIISAEASKLADEAIEEYEHTPSPASKKTAAAAKKVWQAAYQNWRDAEALHFKERRDGR